LRDYVHVSDLASAHVLALDALRAGGESAAYNLGNGRPVSVREVADAVGRVTGRPVPATIGPRRPGDPAVLFASSTKIRTALGWTPRYEDVDVIVETAWRWREAHPPRIRNRGTESPLKPASTAAPLELLAAVPRAVHRRAAGDAGLRRRPGRRRVLIVPDHQQRSCPAPTGSPFRFWAFAIIVAYLRKASGSYFSTYLMTDIGQRGRPRRAQPVVPPHLNQSAAFFSRRTTGQLMSRITNDVGAGAAGGL
jgi:hypothetical protein